MPASWPSGVPYLMQREGLSRIAPDAVLRSPTDSGLARQRTQFSATLKGWRGVIRMTWGQYEDFEEFMDDLAGGTFTWPEAPFTGAACEARFIGGERGVPTPTPGQHRFDVPVAIEIVG